MKGDSNKISIIDKEMTVNGSVAGKGNLVVKGLVEGTLAGDSVVIGEGGRVSADAKVHTMTIGGSFHGHLEASGQLVILSSGTCDGEIICGDLVVEAGGRLDGQVTCKGTNQGGK